MSIQDITERARLNRRIFYRHFADKCMLHVAGFIASDTDLAVEYLAEMA